LRIHAARHADNTVRVSYGRDGGGCGGIFGDSVVVIVRVATVVGDNIFGSNDTVGDGDGDVDVGGV
jgi:hypothetical protein